MPDGGRTGAMTGSGDDWQIYELQDGRNLLLVHPRLAQRWVDADLLDDDLWQSVSFGDTSFRAISSPPKHSLIPLTKGINFRTKNDAIAFAAALRESRKRLADGSLHDAIYLEQYSRLLPTYSISPSAPDDLVLGTCLTGGVQLSTSSFRRLCSLVGWLSPRDLTEIIEIAGLPVPDTNRVGRDHGKSSKGRAQEPAEDAKIDDGAPAPPPRHPDSGEAGRFSLPGRPQLEGFFNEHVVDIISNPERYQALGIEFPSAIVLHGPPGCGKTYAVERLVEFLDWPSYSIDSNSVGSPYIHETSKKISQTFDKAIDSAPSVLVIDEMESFLTDRRAGSSSELHHVEEVAEFLRRIPEATANRVLVIAMTNLIDMIDPAILRRGRFDHIIEVTMPSREEVEALLNALVRRIPTDPALEIGSAIDRLVGKALSDSAFVVREAARIAAKSGKDALDQASLDSALSSLPPDGAKSDRPIGFIWNE